MKTVMILIMAVVGFSAHATGTASCSAQKGGMLTEATSPAVVSNSSTPKTANKNGARR